MRRNSGETNDRSGSSPDLKSGQVHDLPAPGSEGKRALVGVCRRENGAGRKQGAGAHPGMPREVAYHLGCREGIWM